MPLVVRVEEQVRDRATLGSTSVTDIRTAADGPPADALGPPADALDRPHKRP